MPPVVPRPLRRYIEVVAILAALLSATALTRCAPEPLPVPPIPPLPAIAPKQDHRLEAMYDVAVARLRAYRAQPPCAASGPLACSDPVQARDASRLARAARVALARARRAGISAWSAQTRVAAFEAAARKLPTGETP